MEFENLGGFGIGHRKPCQILKEKRLVLELTQKQVAERAGVLLQQYQKFESGERNIMTCSFQLACKIIEALEMNVSDFYHGEYYFGEEIFMSPEGLRYKKTGRLTTEDITDQE